MNKLLFEFYKLRRRVSDDVIRELKKLVDEEYNRRAKAETNGAELIGGLTNGRE